MAIRTSPVSLSACSSYNQSEIDSALHKCLEPLGGISHFVKPGQKVLIKPNALMAKNPEKAVTTHPTLISAVIREVVSVGGTALVGDSPGDAYASVPKVMEESGIAKVVEEAGGKMVYFQEDGIVEVPNPRGNLLIPSIPIARIAVEADIVINLPKLKTHGLTNYTGAIKNLFGTVPGFNKTKFHALFPNPRDFAEALVDVFQIVRPELNIMDAVIGMEGSGPSDGSPRQLGLILASADGVALDAVCSRLISYPAGEIKTTLAAFNRNLGEMRLEKIELFGESLEKFRQANWKRPSSATAFIWRWMPERFYPLLTPLLNQLKVNPLIDQAKCTQCLVCLNNCPAKTIHQDKKSKRVTIDLDKCIHCFCCHELCRYSAVDLRRSWLVKMLKIGYAASGEIVRRAVRQISGGPNAKP